MSSSIFDTSNPPAAPPSRRGAAPHQDTWAPTATYGAPVDGPRPRIVNGKIVKGDDLRNVPAANGPPSPQNSTGLTWAPSPPVIRRRAADEAMVSAVAPPPHYPAAAPAAASQHYHHQQQQQQYEGDREAHHHYAPHGEDLGGVGGGGGGGGGGWRGSGGGGGGGGGEESYHHPAPQAYQPTHAAQQQQHQQQPPVSSARSTGISHSSNAFASGSNQNCGNVSVCGAWGGLIWPFDSFPRLQVSDPSFPHLNPAPFLFLP